MSPNGAPTIALAADESITFDTALATITDTGIKAAEGAVLTSDKATAVWAYSVAAPAPAWPTDTDWAQDADQAVKNKFAAWKADYVGSFANLGAAFLMGVAPGNTVPDLTIDSITVDGTTATVVVSADGVDLKDVNGVLYVESSNNLTDWTAVEYDVPTKDDFSDGKATFTVTVGKFMKAKIGFKAPAAQ